MLYNYLKIAFRNFVRHAGYSFINVSGLSIGIATFLLIFLWVMSEFQFNSSFVDHERIFQVLNNSANSAGQKTTGQSTPAPLAEAMMAEFPEVELAGRIDFGNKVLLRHENKSFMQMGMWADPQILKIFSFQIISGNSTNPLVDPGYFVMTRKAAQRFFPNDNAVGKEFKIDEKYSMTVAAVIENPPANSSLQFDFLIPFEVHYKENPWMARWGNYNDRTFFKLKAAADVAALDNKLRQFLKTKASSNEVFAQQLGDTHLYNHYEDGKPAGGRIEYVRILSITAIFILLIACINYMNLATARSANRSREVGVRKVSGAQRQDLIFQFIGEALLITSISMTLALVIVQMVLPLFNELMNQNLQLNLKDRNFIFGMVGITIVISLISGSYPAFFLSSFRPATVLKGLLGMKSAGGNLRKGLVVFQFALSVALIIFSLGMFQQIKFIKSKNLGFDRENMIVFDTHAGAFKEQETFRIEALKFPGVKNISFAGENPFSISSTTRDVKWLGKSPDESIPFKLTFTDKEFIPTLNLKLLEGRNFTDNKADSANYIINETAASIIGYKEPVGAPLDVWFTPSGKIIGIVKDFHNTNLHDNIEPLIIMCRAENTWRTFAKVESRLLPKAIEHLSKVQKKFDPTYPFDFEFLDKSFQNEYATETMIEKLSILFTSVAILISCLGLFGLAAFTAEQRTKEIGIRKVLGASVSQIVVLLSKDFLQLVVIAFIIAIPISWYGMTEWLKTFAYRIDFDINVPMVAGCTIVFIALATVSYQSIKAAMGNPVNSLRSE